MVNLALWKTRKKELKLTFDELAAITGSSISTLKDIFRGKTTDPRIDTVQAIEKALGLESGGITPEEYEQGARYTKKVSITADEEDILDISREVMEKLGNEKGKELIIEFCNMILDKMS